MAFEQARDEDYRPCSTDMGPEEWLDVDGVRTRYFDRGRGAPLVFFHGGQYGSGDGCSARDWNLNVAPLARHLNAIAVDRLGQGFTDNPKTDADYTMGASVRHALRFLELLSKGPYHIAGHSRGGYLVARLALERPDLVRSCTCVSSGSLSPGVTHTQILHGNLPNWSVRANLRACYELYFSSPRLVTEEMLDEAEKVVTAEKFKLAAQKMNAGVAAKVFMPALVAEREETHRWLMARGMPCPTLVCWGYNDPGAIFELGKQLIELFMAKQPETELCLFNRSGHFVFREYAAQFNRAVHSFVAAHA